MAGFMLNVARWHLAPTGCRTVSPQNGPDWRRERDRPDHRPRDEQAGYIRAV